MKLCVIAPCIYPSKQPLHYLIESCDRNDVPLYLYGLQKQYADWRRMLMSETVPQMKRMKSEGYTHVLYVDGIDSLFVGGVREIAAKYEAAGSPLCLMSADSDIPLSGSPQFMSLGTWRYLNAGGYMGEIDFLVKMWETLDLRFPLEGNYQRWLEESWPVWGVLLDTTCKVFQSMDGHPAVMPCGQRVLNAVTATWPCILHFRGGYCDPQTGRDERMRPWAEVLMK